MFRHENELERNGDGRGNQKRTRKLIRLGRRRADLQRRRNQSPLVDVERRLRVPKSQKAGVCLTRPSVLPSVGRPERRPEAEAKEKPMKTTITPDGNIRIETDRRVAVLWPVPFNDDYRWMDRIDGGNRRSSSGIMLPENGSLVWVANTSDAGAVWSTSLRSIEQYLTRQ